MKNPSKELFKYIAVLRSYLSNKMYYGILFILFVSLTEGMGLALILPMLEVINRDLKGAEGYFYERFGSELSFLDSPGVMVAAVVFIFYSKAVLNFFSLKYIALLKGSLLEKLKLRIYANTIGINYEYFIGLDGGYFSNLFAEQVSRSVRSYHYLNLMISQIIQACVYFFIALYLNLWVGIFVLFLGGVFYKLFGKLSESVRDASRKMAQENNLLNGFYLQILHSFKYLKATNQASFLDKDVNDSIAKLKGFDIGVGVADSITNSIREPLAISIVLFSIVIQIYFFEGSIAPLIVALALVYRAVNYLVRVQGSWQAVLESIGSLEFVDSAIKKMDGNIEARDVRKLNFKKLSSIVLKNVCYSFPNSEINVLNNINLTLVSETSIGIVGESGAGKSTLVNLLCGLYLPTSGNIFVNDICLEKGHIKDWRNRIAYISQEPAIFSTTIRNNVLMSLDNESAQDKEILSYLDQAGLAQFVNKLPDGLNTHVGDKGLNLSGGQRQRLFIARELYRNKELFILDEATSALDTENELLIQDSINDLRGKVTLIIIAHRLSTIKNVDNLIIMKDGEIIESGNYKELSENSMSNFSNMIKQQRL